MFISTLLLACLTETTIAPITLEEAPRREAVALETLSRNTDASLTLQARIVDEYGFAIADQELQFLEDGASEPQIIRTNAFGYANLQPEFADDNSASATVTWNDQTGRSYSVTPSNIPAFRGYLAQYVPTTQTPNFITDMSDGLLIGYDTELWWSPIQTNGFPHRIGTLPLNILGLWSGNIDNDGYLDAVVWTLDSVYLLRGIPDGGVSLEKEYTSLKGSVVAVSIGYFDTDDHADISIATSTEKLGYLTILSGTGSWGFEAQEVLDLNFPIEDAVTGDENHDSYVDVSLVDLDTGIIHRYSYSIEGWVSSAYSIIDPSFYRALPGTSFHPQIDLDLDGNDDLLLFGGEGDDDQSLAIFLTGAILSKYELKPVPYDAIVRKINPDDYPDILTLNRNAKFSHMFFDGDLDDFIIRTFGAPNISGPFMSFDTEDSSYSNLRVLQHQPSDIQGKESELGKWVADIITWKEASSIIIHQSQIIIADANQDGALDVAVIVDEENERKLRIFKYGLQLENLSTIDTIGFSNANVLAFALCNGQYLTITDDGSERILRGISFDGDQLQTNRSSTVNQDSIDCANVNGIDQILLSGGSSVYSVLTANFVQVATGSSNDATMMTLRNDGVVLGCSEIDCQIKTADLDGDGDDETIVKNSSGISIQGLDEDETLFLDGAIETRDVDQDGIEELLVREADKPYVWVLQAKEGKISSIYGLWADRDFLEFPQFGDVEGDGIQQLGLISPNSTLITSK